MTWTVAAALHGTHNGNLSVTNVATGNLVIVEVINSTNSTVWATALSGGGATWTQAGVKFSGTANARSAAIFLGTVTATGSGTVTPTWSGTAPGSYAIASAEFHSSAGSWAFDIQGNLDTTASNQNFPSLTPGVGAGELYFGFCTDGGSAVAGSTSGYVYNANVDGNDDGAAYNLNCGAGATFPAWGDTSQRFGIAILVAESGGAPAVPPELVMAPRIAP